MPERIVKVVKVICDDCQWPVWVRIQYIKDGKLLHDAVFTRKGKNKISLSEKRIENYIPPKRFKTMLTKAAAIMFKKKPKQAIQPELPFTK